MYSCLSYPACKVHAPYRLVVCGLSGCTVFSYIIRQKARFSGTKYTERKNVCFDFIYKLVCNMSHPRIIQRDIIINVHSFSYEVPVIIVRF